MKKKYLSIDKTCLKLSILKESTVVDEKNRRVIHQIDWELKMPRLMSYFFMDIIPEGYEVTGHTKGVAVCHPEDKFDVEIGKKMARAIAETNAYHNAANIVRKRMTRVNKIAFDLDMMSVDFKMKADEIKTHNREYQDSLI